jgi:alpha-ketoglutarate-dependent taurine dioxygenase
LTYQIEICNSVIGAKVLGISLQTVPDQETIDALEADLEKYGVLIFPSQNISPAQQISFSKAFAILELTGVTHARLPGYEEIFVVGNTGEKLVTFSPPSIGGELEWHSDHIHRKVPARASLLYAKEVPGEGGDTLFACMYNAYDDLTEEQKWEYENLRVINSVAGLQAYLVRQGHEFGSDSRDPKITDDQIIWPLVRRHPLTGRKSLYFGNQVSTGIVGFGENKGLEFIRTLTKQACRVEFQLRHQWKKGDVVLWDNRRVLHAGTAYDVENSRRLMHRTTWRETEKIE